MFCRAFDERMKSPHVISVTSNKQLPCKMIPTENQQFCCSPSHSWSSDSTLFNDSFSIICHRCITSTCESSTRRNRTPQSIRVNFSRQLQARWLFVLRHIAACSVSELRPTLFGDMCVYSVVPARRFPSPRMKRSSLLSKYPNRVCMSDRTPKGFHSDVTATVRI